MGRLLASVHLASILSLKTEWVYNAVRRSICISFSIIIITKREKERETIRISTINFAQTVLRTSLRVEEDERLVEVVVPY